MVTKTRAVNDFILLMDLIMFMDLVLLIYFLLETSAKGHCGFMKKHLDPSRSFEYLRLDIVKMY